MRDSRRFAAKPVHDCFCSRGLACSCRSVLRCFSMACWACVTGHRKRPNRGPAGLSLHEPRNNPIELLLQGLEFGSLRGKSLVGELDKTIDLPRSLSDFLRLKRPTRSATPEPAMLRTMPPDRNIARTHRSSSARHCSDRPRRPDAPAEQGLVVGIGRFDLTGERRFGHQQGFGLVEGSRITPATASSIVFDATKR